MYDFANSAFTTVIVTVVYSVYFRNVVVAAGETGTALWGRAVSISMLLVALSVPLLGAVADYSSHKKNLLIFYTTLCIIFTALLYFIKQGDIISGMLFFIIANVGYSSANVFYNAFLPEISSSHNVGKISGWAWGVGYIGGLLSLLAVMPLIKDHIRLVFPLVAVFFAVFSLFTFIFLKEKKHHNPPANYFRIAFSRIKYSFLNIKKLRELIKFIISYFVFNDGIVVIISFASIYGATRFGMTTPELIKYFIVVQITSFIGAVGFGYLLDFSSAKKTLTITLAVWVVVVLSAYFCTSVSQYYLVGLLAGIAIGSSQSSARTMLAKLTPKSKASEFFGFYSMTGRFASILGPLIYGEISRISGNQQHALLAVIAFFVVGGILLQRVDEKKGCADADAWDKKGADKLSN